MASDSIRQEQIGGIRILLLRGPLESRLLAALTVALADTAGSEVVVLMGEGAGWPLPLDVDTEAMGALCRSMDHREIPVVAGLHGRVLGASLELALACDVRVAAGGTVFGFPEVALGLIPGAGGTQRASRLTGAEAALRMMLSGAPVTAEEALAMHLVDVLATGDLTDAVMAQAANARRNPVHARRDGFRDAAGYAKAVAQARGQVAQAVLDAPIRIVDCVEAAQLLPFDQGLAFERAAFDDLRTRPEVAALRHAEAAQVRAARMPGMAAEPWAVAHVTVMGAGAELVLPLLDAGYEVTLADRDSEALVPGLERVAEVLDRRVATGRITPVARDALWARLIPALAAEALGGDLLLLDGPFARPGAGVDLPDRADVPVVTMGRVGAGGAQAVGLGLSGADMAEILVDDDTGARAAASVLALMRRCGRVVVQARGFGIAPALRSAMQAAVRQLDALDGRGQAVIQAWGLDGGPVARGDLARGDAAQVLGAMANAGLHLLGEGKALRPSDIDLVALRGLGLPRHLGGPMFWAQGRGLLVLRNDLQRWADTSPDLFTPAPLLDELIREGVALEALNED